MDLRFRRHESTRILKHVASALFNKGMALDILNRTDEALESYNALVQRFGSGAEPDIRENVANALFHSGILLGREGQQEEAVEAYNNLFHRFGSDENPAVVERVAKGLVNKGGTLGRLGRMDEALLAYDRVRIPALEAHDDANEGMRSPGALRKGLDS